MVPWRRILSPEESVKEIVSSPDYARLVETIARGAFAVVGAGTSVSLGYPAWRALLDGLGLLAVDAAPGDKEVQTAGASDDFLVRARVYERVLGNKLRVHIANTYSWPPAKPLGPLHRDLVGIPFEHFLTTNYDTALEEALRTESGGLSPPHFDLDETAPRGDFIHHVGQRVPPQVIHLHGSSLRSDHIVLTLPDYLEAYILKNDLRFALQNLLAIRPLVFIGFSLSDAYVVQILNELHAYFGPSRRDHFAIVPSRGTNDDRVVTLEWTNKYGVTPIFYDPADDHAALPLFMAALASATRTRRAEVETEAITPAVRQAVKDVYVNSGGSVGAKEAQERLPPAIGRALAFAARGTSVVLASTTPTDARVPLDDEIDGYFEYIKQGQLAKAVALYEAVQQREKGRLSGRLLFRLHANRGHALYAMGKLEQAAAAYLEARSCWESKDARALETLAFILRQDFAAARPLAEALCREFPDFPRAHALRLQVVPPGSKFQALVRGIPRKIRRDVEILNALAAVASDHGNWRAFEAYARAGVKASPQWPEAWLQLGTAILQSAVPQVIADGELGLLHAHDALKITEAKDALDRALGLTAEEASPAFRAAALFNRSSVRKLLGDDAGAANDIEDAYALAPDRHEVVAKYAWLKGRDGDTDSGLRALEAFADSRKYPETSFLWALMLHQRAKDGDHREAAQLLEPLYSDHKALPLGVAPAEVVRLLSEIYVALGDVPRACGLYESLPNESLAPGLRIANIARLSFTVEDPSTHEPARTMLEQAVREHCTKGGDGFARREIAYAAADVGAYAVACKLLQKVTSSVRLTSDGRALLAWARKGQLDLVTLAFGAALRTHGVFDRGAVAHELEALIRCREPQKAIELMQEWLKRCPDDKWMRLNLSIAGIRCRRPALVETNPTRLPSIAEVPTAEQGASVIIVLREGGTKGPALRAAYQLWRKFGDAPACQILIHAVMTTRPPEKTLERASIVDVNSAVTVDLDGGDRRLIVIEDGPDPRPMMDEFASDHPNSRALLNRKVGDRVLLGFKHGTIRVIENKIVFRAQKALAGFETTFPDGSIRSFKVDTDPLTAKDPKERLGEIWNILKADEDRHSYLLGLYRQAGIPISMLAHALGKSTFETTLSLAMDEELGLDVAEGTEEEFAAAMAVLHRAKSLVLDTSALATLVLLGFERRLGQLPFKFIVPEAVLAELRDLLREREDWPSTGAFLGAKGDKVVWEEVSPAQQIAWRDRIHTLIDYLNSHCEIVGGAAILELPHEIQIWAEKVGISSIDAVAIAKKRDIPLWTDDLHIVRILCAPLTVSRAWTQPILQHCAAKGLNRTQSFSALTRLAIAGYRITRLPVEAIVMTMAQEQWSVDAPLTRCLLKYLRIMGGSCPQNCSATRILLLQIWRGCRSKKKAEALIRAVLDQIPHETAIRFIARPLYHPSQGIYGKKEAKSWRRFRRVLRRWRVTN
jgi:tetratricopeptide (TPR) repeat protein